ncbi:hypothetical protein V3C99_000167 [Haemonchus contortus]
MGNESSALTKLRRESKDKTQPMILECEERNLTPMYRKKPGRSLSHGRYSNEMRRMSPKKLRPEPDGTIKVKRAETVAVPNQQGAIYNRTHLTAPDKADSFLSPPTPDRKRSRSICGGQIGMESQAVGMAATTKMNDDSRSGGLLATANGSSRKMSTGGLVPSLNRLRIQQSFKAARPTIGEAILKRAISNRPEMRTFMNRLSEQQIDIMGKQFYSLIADSVEHIEHPEAVQQHAKAFGESYAALCQIGFRPDYFAPLADAAIAECVKLDGGAHKRCETLLAWSQLISAIFTSVRDGYYSRVRFQRRSSLPQGVIAKQLSVDLSKSIDQDAYIR